MILYYRISNDELDDWTKVIVKHVPPSTTDNLLATYLNCEELIPEGTILCDNEGLELFKVGDSKNNNGYYSHLVEPLPVQIVKTPSKQDIVESFEPLENVLKNYPDDVPNFPKMLIRKLVRTMNRLHEIEQIENLTPHGHWEIGYNKGKISTLENVLDELYPEWEL